METASTFMLVIHVPLPYIYVGALVDIHAWYYTVFSDNSIALELYTGEL
jgi:hypothetical protein